MKLRWNGKYILQFYIPLALMLFLLITAISGHLGKWVSVVAACAFVSIQLGNSVRS